MNYLDDSLLLYKGVVKDALIQGNEINLQIENSTFTVQKQLPQIIASDSDGAGGGFLPDESKGKPKPIIYGDYRTNISNLTASSTELFSKRHLCPAIYIGVDADGDHRWLLSHHQVDAIDEIWMYWAELDRFVQLTSFVVEQNNSSGCIISHGNYEDVYFYPSYLHVSLGIDQRA